MDEFTPRPAFNVGIPFQGTITVQMNVQFATLLQYFIEDVNKYDRVETELWAFRHALADPAGSQRAREEKRLKRFE